MNNATYSAPAKVNLHLLITDILDNGYHQLDTSFVFVDVADHLHIQACDTLEVHCSNPAIDAENNLVYTVLRAFQQHYHIAQGLCVHIDKQLPSQAGLGGGSSDAATALMVANRIWNTHASMDDLIAFATPFGADIPCFLYRRASVATGIGEQLQPYPSAVPTQWVLLAFPGGGLSTRDVFQHFDAHHALHTTTTLTTRASKDKVRPHSDVVGKNDLEASACALSSEVNRLLAFLRQYAKQAWMSGSGTCCVALLPSEVDAQALSDTLQQQQLATWTHIGHFLTQHPIDNSGA